MKIVKALVMDVDGTLTNGQINIGIDGEIYKSFYCRDGIGIINIASKGVIPVILTSRDSKIVNMRAEELNIQYVLQGAGDNKIKVLKKFLEEHYIGFDETAYIGDDINDLDCMRLCSIVGCPLNAVEEVKKEADYICIRNGGEGAVREFIDWLISVC